MRAQEFGDEVWRSSAADLFISLLSQNRRGRRYAEDQNRNAPVFHKTSFT
jgi:hypothetical protein